MWGSQSSQCKSLNTNPLTMCGSRCSFNVDMSTQTHCFSVTLWDVDIYIFLNQRQNRFELNLCIWVEHNLNTAKPFLKKEKKKRAEQIWAQLVYLSWAQLEYSKTLFFLKKEKKGRTDLSSTCIWVEHNLNTAKPLKKQKQRQSRFELNLFIWVEHNLNTAKHFFF